MTACDRCIIPEEKREVVMKTDKQGFRIDAGRPAAAASMIAFVFCIPLQIMGYADRLREPAVAVELVFLPALSALLMIAVILRHDQKALRFSSFAVGVGIIGFAFKLVMDPRETGFAHHFLASVLYIGIFVLWTLTVFYVIKTKWVLVLLFPIPFFKHVILDDIPVLLGTAAPLGASAWLKELCMLSFMLALFFFAVSLEKMSVP